MGFSHLLACGRGFKGNAMTGAERIARERTRQIEKEGWDAWHDGFEHQAGGLVRAAICYAPTRRRG